MSTIDIARTLNSTSIGRGVDPQSVVDLQNKYTQAASDAVTGSSRYPTIGEMQESGFSYAYNGIQRDMIMVKGYKIAGDAASRDLNRELEVLRSIKQGLTDFRKIPLADLQNDKLQICNTALEKARNLLNTQVDGQYLFRSREVGPNVPPCNDLVATSNIVHGKITNNYTPSSPNPKRVQISDVHNVEIGVWAGSDAFQQAIGALNIAKAGDMNDKPTASKYDEAMNKAISLIDVMILQNGFKQDTVAASKKYNENVKEHCEQELQDTFQMPFQELAKNAQSAKQNLLIGNKMLESLYRTFSLLLQ